MKQFVYDMVNMTEVQKLVHYWWLWLGVIVIGLVVISIVTNSRTK